MTYISHSDIDKNINYLKTKWFFKWAKKSKINDAGLKIIVTDLKNKASSVNLGGGLYKVRVSKSGIGKSGGFRSIIAYKKGDRLIFLFGFSKNEKENLSKEELTSFKKLAGDLLKLRAAEKMFYPKLRSNLD